MPVKSSPGSTTTGVTLEYVSVTLGGTGRGMSMSISPVLISSPGGGVRPGNGPGAGVMRMMSGNGVVLIGTAPSSSAAEGKIWKTVTFNSFKTLSGSKNNTGQFPYVS